jgi:hypothetical protein
MIKKTPHRPKDMNQLAKMIVDLSTGDYEKIKAEVRKQSNY